MARQEVTFRPQARIVRTLGDRLISGEVAAIVELVKNSYDADATACHVKFDPDNDMLVIEDDGHGMSVKDVLDNWIELGTDNKIRDTQQSKSGKRSLLGSKGIGRLASAKLGRFLKIESTVKHGGKFESVLIDGLDWEKFSGNDKNTKYVDQIKFYVENVKPKEQSGTKLTISTLAQEWDKERLINLIRELRKLVSPVQDEKIQFDIHLDLTGFTKEKNYFDGAGLLGTDISLFSHTENEGKGGATKITPFPILDACDYTFHGDYTGNKLTGTLTINDTGVEHEITAEIDERVDLGSGLIQLNIFDRDADSIRNTVSRAGLTQGVGKTNISLREARKLLDDLSGIAIYRNKFRIRPYGDKDADWLGLNKRRIQNPSKHIEQAQVSGLVLVDSAENSDLIERSSREGFEHNDNFRALIDLITKTISEIELHRFAHNARIRKNRDKPGDKAKTALFSLKDRVGLEKLDDFSKDFGKQNREKYQAVLTEYRTSLEELVEIIEGHQALLEARTTLGFLLAEVVHEAKNPTSLIRSSLSSLRRKLDDEWKDNMDSTIRDELIEHFDRNIENTGFLNELYRRLDPLIMVRRKKGYEFSIYEPIEKAILLLKDRAEREKVDIQCEEPKIDCKINGLEVDIYAAMINIIDNALYWHKIKKTENPFIKISYENVDNKFYIFIDDNAGGVPEKFQEFIFNVGFTTKENGSGLGLSIAREALGRAGGYISHENIEPNGSRFTIEMQEVVL